MADDEKYVNHDHVEHIDEIRSNVENMQIAGQFAVEQYSRITEDLVCIPALTVLLMDGYERIQDQNRIAFVNRMMGVISEKEFILFNKDAIVEVLANLFFIGLKMGESGIKLYEHTASFAPVVEAERLLRGLNDE